jgi:hypothetical protein
MGRFPALSAAVSTDCTSKLDDLALVMQLHVSTYTKCVKMQLVSTAFQWPPMQVCELGHVNTHERTCMVIITKKNFSRPTYYGR